MGADMIRDDIFLTTMYECPPESEEEADERMQFLYAHKMVPEDDEDADKRMKLAGAYPTNLIGMLWQNADQFERLLTRRNWRTRKVVIMDAGPRRRVYAGFAVGEGDNQFAFIIEEMPGQARTICARTIKVNKTCEKWLAQVQSLMTNESFKDLLEAS
jgi:hypothetical protein